MIDVQCSEDDRGIPIEKVGVKNVRYPIQVLDKNSQYQSTVAQVSMYVDLPHDTKGTHMSRFIEVLNHYRGEITLRNIQDILVEMVERLDSMSAHIEVGFPYFLEKEAPVSKCKSLMDYNCKFIGNYRKDKDNADMILEVCVPVTAVCPCSKAISDRGAHNQRSEVAIQIRYSDFVWIEELIDIAENSASSGVYSLLKREDEKFVTEQAYDNPVFVEDLVRGVSEKLAQDPRILWFKVESENFESIHNHSAFATSEQLRVADKQQEKEAKFVSLPATSPVACANFR